MKKVEEKPAEFYFLNFVEMKRARNVGTVSQSSMARERAEICLGIQYLPYYSRRLNRIVGSVVSEASSSGI